MVPGRTWRRHSRLCDTLTDEGWKKVLADQFKKDYYKAIESFVATERSTQSIFPPHNEVFNAFNFTPWDKVRVVILGQDPYIKPGEAEGLCFSVKKGVTVPASLKRIFKVIQAQIPEFEVPTHGSLVNWAHQGVLLLNATLTVRQGKSNSHATCGWKDFTDAVMRKLNAEKEGLIFFLWGKDAKAKGALIDTERHHVLECSHPSPLAGNGFIDNCDHFQKANELLAEAGLDEIDWNLA